MRSIIQIVLLTLVGGCSDPERPDDFSVELWGSCEWEGSINYDLCRPHLSCVNRVCVQPCAESDDTICPVVDGRASQCIYGECSFPCDYSSPTADDACPNTGGVPLMCGTADRCVGE